MEKFGLLQLKQLCEFALASAVTTHCKDFLRQKVTKTAPGKSVTGGNWVDAMEAQAEIERSRERLLKTGH